MYDSTLHLNKYYYLIFLIIIFEISNIIILIKLKVFFRREDKDSLVILSSRSLQVLYCDSFELNNYYRKNTHRKQQLAESLFYMLE